MPIGMPGWPLLAFSTASIESARMALAIWSCVTFAAMLLSRIVGFLNVGALSARRRLIGALGLACQMPVRSAKFPPPAAIGLPAGLANSPVGERSAALTLASTEA